MNEERMKRDAHRALVETVPAYEGALATLKAGILPSIVQSKWLNYGGWGACRICRALMMTLRQVPSFHTIGAGHGSRPICRLCPIGDGGTLSACALELRRGAAPEYVLQEVNRAGETFADLLKAIHARLLNTEEMIAAFQARLDWIIDTAEKNGYDVWKPPSPEETDG